LVCGGAYAGRADRVHDATGVTSIRRLRWLSIENSCARPKFIGDPTHPFRERHRIPGMRNETARGARKARTAPGAVRASAPPGVVDTKLTADSAIRAAYAAHGAELYRFALRALRDEGAAQDVVQETFLRAWRAADRYDSGRSSLRVWLFAIARNVVIDHARRRSAPSWPSVPADPDVVGDGLDPVPDPVERLVSTWVIEEALRRLSATHRQAIVETYLLGRPQDEVAAEIGIPVGTLRSRLHYALKSMRVALDDLGVPA
jgi:RNA polymerase sigma-70 factor (ECF subfamily)